MILNSPVGYKCSYNNGFQNPLADTSTQHSLLDYSSSVLPSQHISCFAHLALSGAINMAFKFISQAHLAY